jgi:putative hemolysin
VATEFAIVAVRRARLEQLAAAGSTSARAAKDVVGHLDAYIAACQLGITRASLALGWIGEPTLAALVEPPLEWLVGRFAPAAAHGVAIGVSFALFTALHIVIGELAPKGLALQRPEATTLCIARPIRLFYALFRWPITGLNAVGNGVLRLAGLEPAAGHEMVHSVEELRILVTASQQAGAVEATEARIASHAFAFGELTAAALMTPRTELEAVPVTAPPDELLALAASGRHSRVLVYEGSLDEVVGVLHVRDLFPVLGREGEAFDLRALVRPVLMVPATKRADDLLEEMRAARRRLALVIDEYGGTAGVVTLEDLMEALVGRIEDEPPPGAEPALAAPDPSPSTYSTGALDPRVPPASWPSCGSSTVSGATTSARPLSRPSRFAEEPDKTPIPRPTRVSVRFRRCLQAERSDVTQRDDQPAPDGSAGGRSGRNRGSSARSHTATRGPGRRSDRRRPR